MTGSPTVLAPDGPSTVESADTWLRRVGRAPRPEERGAAGSSRAPLVGSSSGSGPVNR